MTALTYKKAQRQIGEGLWRKLMAKKKKAATNKAAAQAPKQTRRVKAEVEIPKVKAAVVTPPAPPEPPPVADAPPPDPATLKRYGNIRPSKLKNKDWLLQHGMEKAP